ncbi:CBO0543 family protein [Paenibacillus dendritiformis]|uniref:CBO0543 family protein n=1 Tax=Paenibacillus dendritiformis TaxID=130049 RepID=UPI003B75C845
MVDTVVTRPIRSVSRAIAANIIVGSGLPKLAESPSKGLYHFPHRLLPEIFSIHIVFTLIGLPILTMVFLYSLSQVNRLGKSGIILFCQPVDADF